MHKGMQQARDKLEQRVAADTLLAGMYVRVHGEHLILGRVDEHAPDAQTGNDDRLRLTRLRGAKWGLSVKRHTGRWERTPFDGDFDAIIGTVHAFMQHLVAPL